MVLLCLALYVIWVEIGDWRTIRRFGRSLDLAVLVGLHVALGARLGGRLVPPAEGVSGLSSCRTTPDRSRLTWRDGLIYGVRIGATYMGYVVFAAGRRAAACPRCSPIRGRRLYAIARSSIRESNRRMWAPWVVITVFLLVLAFTHWFLQPPRPAEMGRLYVGTLTLLCSVLLTVMVTILTPLSLPTDIQQQTIYTVVSKPVRRLELIWGRMIGYMAIVTVLVLVFGVISLFYLWRTVGSDDPRRPRPWRPRRRKRTALTDAKLLTRAGRPAPHPDAGPRSGQGIARRSSTRAARRTRWGSTWARSSR